jgi:hypothetical protein
VPSAVAALVDAAGAVGHLDALALGPRHGGQRTPFLTPTALSRRPAAGVNPLGRRSPERIRTKMGRTPARAAHDRGSRRTQKPLAPGHPGSSPGPGTMGCRVRGSTPPRTRRADRDAGVTGVCATDVNVHRHQLCHPWQRMLAAPANDQET